jgi:hypothetical protein
LLLNTEEEETEGEDEEEKNGQGRGEQQDFWGATVGKFKVVR